MARTHIEVPLPGRLRLSRGLLAALLVALVLVAALAIKSLVSSLAPSPIVRASGTLEATESDVSPKVQGRLIDLRVRDGDLVKRGQTLAVLESVDPGLSLDQAQANLDAARAQVAAAQAAYDLQRQTYGTTLEQAGAGVGIARSRLGQANEQLGIESRTATLAVDQARAQVAAAQSGFDRARVNFERAQSLVATGDEPQQMLDDATADYKAADAQLRAANDAVADARANLRTIALRQLDVVSSEEERTQSFATLESAQAERQLVEQRHAQLLAAQAAMAQAKAAVGLAKDQVGETRLLAPFDGAVMSHNFENGDLVQAGSQVLTVGDVSHPYAYVYVSETQVPRIKTGMRADVSVDGIPGRKFSGVVTEIADQAEFTPENVQTKEERIEYLVFRVKIQFSDSTGLLKPGLPVDAEIRT